MPRDSHRSAPPSSVTSRRLWRVKSSEKMRRPAPTTSTVSDELCGLRSSTRARPLSTSCSTIALPRPRPGRPVLASASSSAYTSALPPATHAAPESSPCGFFRVSTFLSPETRSITSSEPALVLRGPRVMTIEVPSGDQRGATSSSTDDEAISRTAPPFVEAMQSVDTRSLRPPRLRMKAICFPSGDQSPSNALSISLRGSPPTTGT
jgi:hypothetical protein